jgi:hypothetical protein
MRRQRLILISSSAILSLILVLVAALLLSQSAPPAHAAVCERYPLIPQVQVCAHSVYLVTHGQRHYMGRTADMAPMPQPPRH